MQRTKSTNFLNLVQGGNMDELSYMKRQALIKPRLAKVSIVYLKPPEGALEFTLLENGM